MQLKELFEQATEIRKKYAELEIKTSGKPWGALERTQGFVADAGELMKLMMAKSGLRQIDNVDAKLSHELCDCLWSILVIADELGIDIEKEFLYNMGELEKRIKKEI
jgi:NTP pyrophosphatase (non-canonical NTP hydrolase)